MKILIIALSLISFAGSAFAAETIGEKASAKTNNVKRKMKHKVNSVEEGICDKTDKSCLAEKAKNRTNETKDYATDKVKEGKNVIDNN